MDINKEENLINKDNRELKEMFGDDVTDGNNNLDINYSKPKENNQLTKDINDNDTESNDSAPIGKKI